MINTLVGIDPGVRTGIAVYSVVNNKFISIDTLMIHQAILLVSSLDKSSTFIRVEDARLRTWYGESGREVLQGVGSVKRDCTIWDSFLKDCGYSYEMKHPIKGGTKMNESVFKGITGWAGRTSSHSRDAAMLVFNLIIK